MGCEISSVNDITTRFDFTDTLTTQDPYIDKHKVELAAFMEDQVITLKYIYADVGPWFKCIPPIPHGYIKVRLWMGNRYGELNRIATLVTWKRERIEALIKAKLQLHNIVCAQVMTNVGEVGYVKYFECFHN